MIRQILQRRLPRVGQLVPVIFGEELLRANVQWESYSYLGDVDRTVSSSNKLHELILRFFKEFNGLKTEGYLNAKREAHLQFVTHTSSTHLEIRVFSNRYIYF